MKMKAPPATLPARREPKTQRGRDTREEILVAARQLLSQRWVDEIPFNELAAAAGVARASLLHAFPHWRNVLFDLLAEELDVLDASYATAVALKRVRPGDRVYAMLAPLLDRAETTGRLYANLRGAMFTCQGVPSDEHLSEEAAFLPPGREMLGAFMRIELHDNYAAIEDLLRIPRNASLKPNEFGPVPVGESLVNLTLDLAAGIPTYLGTFEDRRHALRTTIELIAAGLRRSRLAGIRKRR